MDREEGSRRYGIPASNPFVGVYAARDEIWALGLRNPWRFTFDPMTGDMFIGDVGFNTKEEVSFNKNDAGFKFLPVPLDKFDDLYVPSVFTAEDYPGYVKPGERLFIVKGIDEWRAQQNAGTRCSARSCGRSAPSSHCRS